MIGQLLIKQIQRDIDASIEESKRELLKKLRENASGKVLKKKTGKLAESLSVILLKHGTSYLLEIVSSVPYARIQDEGGTILPKRAKYLTIPLAQEAKGKRASNFTDTFFLKSKTGKAFIAQRYGESFRTLFLLKKKVKIKGTNWIKKAIDELYI